MLPFVAVGLAFGIQCLFAFLLRSWGKRVAARHGGGRGWRAAGWLPIAALVIGSAGLMFTLVGVFGAFRAVGRVPEAEKHKVLEAGLNEAMVAVSLTGPIASWLYLGSVVLFAIGSMMKPARGP